MAYEKLCVFCKNSKFNTMGCHGDYPDPAYFECRENMLPKGDCEIDYDLKEFRKVILTAEKCAKYKEAK